MRATPPPRSRTPALLGALLLVIGCDAGQSTDPNGPPAGFRVTLVPEAGEPATVRGDSATWRNDGPPIHRVFRLVLHAPAAPAGYPAGLVRITVGGYGSEVAGEAIPAVGTWPVHPSSPMLGTSVSLEIGDRWRGTAVAGMLVIERADAEVVEGSLEVTLAVQEDLEPRPGIALRGGFAARAFEE